MKQIENEVLLIRRFKNGDSKVFEILFEKHHRKLYSFLFRLMKSKEDAEEIVQDTFIKIWERRAEFEEGYPFESFLFKIAKNSFLNATRKKINRRVVEDNLYTFSDILENSTEDYIIFKETREMIDLVINSLPPKRKEIFILSKIEGLSRKEIAEKMGVSIITVDGQLLKANRHLREKLGKYGLLLFIFFMN
jgi:RNA polymerase sigma-70 factor (family 1)